MSDCLSLSLPPCLVLLWPSKKFSWLATVEEVMCFPGGECRLYGEEPGRIQVKLNRWPPWLWGWALRLLSLSWNLVAFLESNFCVPKTKADLKHCHWTESVNICHICESAGGCLMVCVSGWRWLTTTRQFTSRPQGFQPFQLPPQVLLFSLKQAGIVPWQKRRLGFTELWIEWRTHSLS